MRKISTALLIILILVVPLLAFAEGNATADRTISFEESSYVVYAGKAQKIVVTVENAGQRTETDAAGLDIFRSGYSLGECGRPDYRKESRKSHDHGCRKRQ